MKRLLFVLLLTCSLCVCLSAQIVLKEVHEDLLTFDDRLYYGLNLSSNLGLGGNLTFVDVSPLVGYIIRPYMSLGFGVTYQYVSRKYFINGNPDQQRLRSSNYGARLFLRPRLKDRIFTHLELEALDSQFLSSDNIKREWVSGLFIGIGGFKPLFERGGLNGVILYNFLHDAQKSPYGTAWIIRVGITL